MKRLSFLALLAVFLALPALAGDCDDCLKKLQPKDCAERIARAKANGCVIPCGAAPCATQPCAPNVVTVQAPCEPQPCQSVPCAPTVVREPFQVNVPMEPHGGWLLGAGPVYYHGLGVAAVTGYRFKRDWEIVGGPLWVPGGDTHGMTSKESGCVVPFTAKAKDPWGVQVLAVYSFD